MEVQTLTLVVAAIGTSFGGYVAWQQWQTNRNKLKFDLYEKRLATYSKVHEFIVYVHTGEAVEYSEVWEFEFQAMEIKWLLDDKAYAMVKELIEKSKILADLQAKAGSLNMPENEKEEEYLEAYELRRWFGHQDKVVEDIFTPYLNLKS